MDTKDGGKMHVVMLPWLAFGHVLPFTEFAKRVARQGHRVTFLSTPRNTRRLIDIPPGLAGLIRVVDVQLPRVEHLPEHAEATIDLPSDDLRPYLRRAYDAAFQRELSLLLQEAKPDWVLVDYASYWAPAAAARHGVPCAFLSLFGAAALSFFGTPEALLGLGRHAKTEPAHFTVVPEYVPFPTTVAFRGYEARGMFKPRMVPLQRIALGLQASGLPFIWAFRAPTDAVSGGLPEGFEERVAGRGVVCRGWVPQVRFLAHASVGGFLTHAGWNSITEGLAQGVRLVLLPLVFEQGLNARNLVDKKISMEVARDEQDGSFAADDIAAALRRVMVEGEGEQFGAKVKELVKVFGDDEVNDTCVRDFLRHLSEHSKKNQG
ncbi:unnamed protein product [Triticum turgidum subsp. durum]|uniref:Glycosyltransferase n=2 Tax=Triticum TaxID=4564 RepID=A0A9R1S6I7_TRITD|nr:unnamed protein product [Triticum aestivum]VAH82159.1 unnamed protein product [Triticum turgidum subsp. durum]